MIDSEDYNDDNDDDDGSKGNLMKNLQAFIFIY